MERVRERYQIRGRFVLYAGNIKPHKNLDRLIAAFGLLKQRAGPRGPEAADHRRRDQQATARCAAAWRRAGVRQDVRFFGFVPDQTLAALYRLASVFAFPSLYEGFGLPPLEAMACGTPVVTSRISSLPEVVGDAALLVDPYSVDDIAAGLRARARRRRPARRPDRRAAARASQHFSWERSVRAIHAGYMRALGRPRARAVARRGAALSLRKVAARPRLADRACAAARRSCSRWPASSPTRRSSRCCTCAGSRAPGAGGARDPHHVRAAPARGRAALPPLPAALPRRRRVASTSRLRPRGLQLALRGQGRARPRRARCTSATATRPMRYVWDRYDDYFGPGERPPARRALVPVRRRGLRAWDVATAARVHAFAANSALRGRPHPALLRPRGRGDPAAGGHRLLHARAGDGPGAYDLVVSALAPYKRLELVLRGLPRHGPAAEDRGQRARGGAPARAWLRRRSSFSGRVDDATLRDALPRLPRRHHARRRGLRHRAAGGHGLRPAGGRLRRRAAGAESVVDGRDGRASSTSPRRPRCAPPLTRWRPCVLIRRALRAAGRGLQPAAVFEARFRAFVERASAEASSRQRRSW